MTERPIIFSGPMVKAILDGRKTMTRRIVKPQPGKGNVIFYFKDRPYNCTGEPQFEEVNRYSDYVRAITCPYGIPGDRLYARETHYRYGKWVKNGLTKIGRQKWTFKSLSKNVVYSDNPPNKIETEKTKRGWFKRPSIFMPRWASRITLEVVNVRVERLQEITEEEIRAEGLDVFCSMYYDDEGNKDFNEDEYRWHFERLWDSIYGKTYPWASNPWVWQYGFRSIT